jgi:hypothetical protein
MEIKAVELAAAIKAQVASGKGAIPGQEVKRLAKECDRIHSSFRRELHRVQREIGLSETEIRAIEQKRDASSLPAEADTNFWRADIEQFSPTGYIDDLIEPAMTRLLSRVDPIWLDTEAAKPYRLGPEFLGNPLHLVSGVRVGTGIQKTAPQRFARMLLLSRDHMMKRPDVDFFSAAMCVPEVAQLGNCIDEIKELGPEASRKLTELPYMTDEQVSATVFELLVGAACIRRGIALTMVPEDRSGNGSLHSSHGRAIRLLSSSIRPGGEGTLSDKI